MSLSPRVVLYLPFYNGLVEARQARMHDLIHFLNRQEKLHFAYTVLADTGTNKDSQRIYFGSIPGLSSRAQTYDPSRRYAFDRHHLLRLICLAQLWVRCKQTPPPDIFHAVRINRVSKMLERLFRKRNPRLRVMVGPNIMSYDDLKATYDPAYFQQEQIETVLSVGSHHLEQLQAFGVPRGKLQRLPPSVDGSVFYPPSETKRGDSNEKLCILFAASQLAVQKGTNIFLQALQLLKQDERVPFTALIAGSEELIPGVQTLFDQTLLQGLEDIVQRLGRVPRKDMANLYRRADVFVHTSQLEAGPTTTIEALSCGTPCIVPDHPSFKEPELMAGLRFFEAGEPEALKESLVVFYEDWKAGQTPAGFIPTKDEQDTVGFLEELYAGKRAEGIEQRAEGREQRA